MSSPANTVFLVIHHGVARGQAVLNTSHWYQADQDQGINSAAHEALLLDTVAARWVSEFIPLMHVDYVYQFSRLLAYASPLPNEVDPDTEEVLTWKPGFGTDILNVDDTEEEGGQLTNGLPLTVAVICQKFTDLHGRRWRGRMKVSPITSNQQLDDKLTTTALGDFNTAWDQYTNPILVNPSTSITYVPCVFSVTEYLEKNVTQPPAMSARFLDSVNVNNVLGTQRSRKFNPAPG